MESPCPQCGARYPPPTTCADRFAALLALDHSRSEPWGSRHGLAFDAATYVADLDQWCRAVLSARDPGLSFRK